MRRCGCFNGTSAHRSVTCPVHAGSTTVQRQQVGGPPVWWQQLLSATLGGWLQHVIG